jgi:hypothetical protein
VTDVTASLPKRMGHIWIGPKPAPDSWMRSWPEKHPEWDYRVYDNQFLQNHRFRTRNLINEYFWRGEYAGVQDLMRYEILYEFGGFMADADAVCLHPVDELLTGPGAYTVYDRPGEEGRGVSPFLACEPRNPLVGEVIERLSQLEPWELRKPFHSTGNLFLMSLIRQWGEDRLTIWPSHYFIPWHHTEPENVYRGPDKIYAEQMWGSATWSYNRGEDEGSRKVLSRNELSERAASLRQRLIGDLLPQQRAEGFAEAAARFAPAVQPKNILSPDFKRRVQQLNAALVARMAEEKLEPVFHGRLFYRDRQRHPITESPFMTRTSALRDHLAVRLAGARNTIQIGVDTAHLLLLHKSVQPAAQIVAFDSCHPLGRNAARTDVYVPAAMEWISDSFPGDITFLSGRPARTLPGHFQRNPGWKADLLHFNGIDENFLKCYGAAISALRPDGDIFIHDADPSAVKARLEQLQMIGEVGEPFEYEEFGNGGGAFLHLRRLGTLLRQERVKNGRIQ